MHEPILQIVLLLVLVLDQVHGPNARFGNLEGMNPTNQAVVLVGGRGTRLGELTQATPKPMLPVGGRPFLEYLVQLLAQNGFTRVLFCVSHLADVIRNHFGSGASFGVEIDYSTEPVPSGTGGALVLAREKLDDTFLVMNGDTVFDIPMQQLIQLVAANPESKGAIALRKVQDVARYGSVRLQDSLILGFNEKGPSGPGLINGGLYCLRKDALDMLPAQPYSLERDLFPKLATAGLLRGAAFESYFIDIGVPETLSLAQTELPSRHPECFKPVTATGSKRPPLLSEPPGEHGSLRQLLLI